MDSRRLVTSLSMTRAALSGMLNDTVSDGRLRDGLSLTGSNGTSAAPTIASARKATMTVNEDRLLVSFLVTAYVRLG